MKHVNIKNFKKIYLSKIVLKWRNAFSSLNVSNLYRSIKDGINWVFSKHQTILVVIVVVVETQQ